MFRRAALIIFLQLAGASYFAEHAAAYYAAEVGRFLTRDPIGPADGPNLYGAYFAPHAVDPSGNQLIGGEGLSNVNPVMVCKSVVEKHNQVFGEQIGRFCPGNVTARAACVPCGEKGAGGTTECSDTANGISLVMKICVDNIPAHVKGEDALRGYFTTLLNHESVHVLDYCHCSSKCKMYARGRFFPKEDCVRWFCTEIRAFCHDGSCDNQPTEAARKRCVYEKIRQTYLPLASQCRESNIQAAIDKCYIPRGQDPNYPHPVLQ